MSRARSRILPFVAVLITLSPLLVAQEALAVTFTHGVASGDVTPFSALLWTRVDEEVQLTVEVSRATVQWIDARAAGADHASKVGSSYLTSTA